MIQILLSYSVTGLFESMKMRYTNNYFYVLLSTKVNFIKMAAIVL